MKKIRLLLVEDDPLLLAGLTEIFKRKIDIKVVAASSNQGNTILKINKQQPNIVLVDLGLRSQRSLAVVARVKKEFPLASVIVMDLAPVPADIKLFAKAGASGFILRDDSIEQFLGTIRTVAGGGSVLPAVRAELLFAQIIEHAICKGKSTHLFSMRRNGTRRATMVHAINAKDRKSATVNSVEEHHHVPASPARNVRIVKKLKSTAPAVRRTKLKSHILEG